MKMKQQGGADVQDQHLMSYLNVRGNRVNDTTADTLSKFVSKLDRS